MTNIDKNIAPMTDDPQLQQMAEEVQQAYELKKQGEKAPAVDEAWKRFNAKYRVTEEVSPSITPRHSFWKRYGVAASLLLACMVAVAITVVRNVAFPPSEETDASPSAELNAAMDDIPEEIEENETTIVYRNIALSQIVEQLAQEHNARVEYLASGDVRLYVELDRSWSLQQSLDFLNHFEQVNLSLTSDQVIEVR